MTLYLSHHLLLYVTLQCMKPASFISAFEKPLGFNRSPYMFSTAITISVILVQFPMEPRTNALNEHVKRFIAKERKRILSYGRKKRKVKFYFAGKKKHEEKDL